jgi:hypothetical protein
MPVKLPDGMPAMTVRELRESLALLGTAHDDKPVCAWLPGSRIALSGTLTLGGSAPGTLPSVPAVLMEGNVISGSALDDVTASGRPSGRDRYEAEGTTLRRR